MKAESNWDDVRRTLATLFGAGEAWEVRVLKGVPRTGWSRPRTIAGYFDDPEKAVGALAGVKAAEGVYFTMNPVNRDLLSRYCNRLDAEGGETTKDKDVARRRRFVIDIDPERPSGISSTEEELASARRKANEVVAGLAGMGFPPSMAALSGNGCHVVHEIDLPNDQDSGELLKRCLEALDYMFSDGSVHIDRALHNASRIIKLWGTVARKGDDTERRPHRASAILSMPEGFTANPCPREALERLAACRPARYEDFTKLRKEIEDATGAVITKDSAEWRDRLDELERGVKVTTVKARAPGRKGRGGEWDVRKWIAERGVEVLRDAGDKIFVRCPWAAEHSSSNPTEAAILIQDGGAVAYKCQHDHCSGRGWREFRLRHEPGAYDPKQRRAPAPGTEEGGFRRLRLKRGEDIGDLDEDTMWLVPGIVPRHGITYFYSDPGAGKSLTALDLAVALTHDGKLWLSNREVRERGAVLYLTLDQDEKLTKRRELLLGGSGRGDIYYVDGSELDPMDCGGAEALEDVFKQAEAAGTPIIAVLVDVWADLAPAAPSRKDAYMATSDAMRTLKRVVEGRGVATILLSHMNKEGLPQGSVAQWGKAEAAYVMAPAPVGERRAHGDFVLGKRVVVSTLKNRLGMAYKSWAIDMWFEDGDSRPGDAKKAENRKILVFREDSKAAAAESNKAKVVEALSGSCDPGQALSPSAIADLAKDAGARISLGGVQKALQRLHREGVVEKSGRGLYYLADAEFAAALDIAPPPDWTSCEPYKHAPLSTCPLKPQVVEEEVVASGQTSGHEVDKWTSPRSGVRGGTGGQQVDTPMEKEGVSTSCPLRCPDDVPRGATTYAPSGHEGGGRVTRATRASRA
ncbi:AAA family ATPase [Verrucomicrobiota bacterium]